MTAHTPEPGVYENVPPEDYHSWAAIGSTTLNLIATRSPAHARDRILHPESYPSTEAMRFGNMLHTRILEPAVFEKRFAMEPPGSRRTKAYKEAVAKLQEAGKEIITREQEEKLEHLESALNAHQMIGPLLEGIHELSIVWKDPATGLLCKGRLDSATQWMRCIVDLKTTRDASPDGFSRAIWNYGYHRQAAHYLKGAKICGLDCERFVFAAIEKDPPHGIAIYMLDRHAVEVGDQDAARALQRYAQCEKARRWEPYPADVVDITLPDFAWRTIHE